MRPIHVKALLLVLLVFAGSWRFKVSGDAPVFDCWLGAHLIYQDDLLHQLGYLVTAGAWVAGAFLVVSLLRSMKRKDTE